MTRGKLWGSVSAVILVVSAAAWTLPRMSGEPPAARPQPTAPSESNGTTLRFPAGAPQLAFLRTSDAILDAEPLLEALPGRIAYDEDRTARLGAPMAGRVTRIAATLGTRVRRGDLLAVIASPEYAQAVSDVRRAELEARHKGQAFDRARVLFEGEVMPRREFESLETDLREAEVELGRARRRLELLSSGGPAENGELPIRAPLAGVVTERSINPGTLVGPDTAQPLFVISDPENLRVVIDVPEQHIGVLRTGQHVSVEVDAYSGRRFDATVVYVGDVLDPASRRIQVRCRIDNAGRLLKPEMYARVTPVMEAQSPRVRVPIAAIVTAGVNSYVFVETRPGQFERRQVTASTQGREFAYLRSGVAAGERVVVSGASLLNSELQGS